MFLFALLAISVQLYWMIATNHWMGAVYGSVLHVIGVDGALPKLHATSSVADTDTDTDTDRHRHRDTDTDLLIDMFTLEVHINIMRMWK